MKKNAFFIIITILLLSFCIVGCSSNNNFADYCEDEYNGNSIIGSWEDENELITFYDDKTFSSFYYWTGGSYILDKTNSKIALLGKSNGKEECYYTLDDDTLTLYSDAEMTNVKYCFTRVEEEVKNEIAAFNKKMNPIIGRWEDEEDVVTFNDNETFNSFFYWMGGSYMLNKSNSKITLLGKMSGKEEYYYTIDHDILILYSDAEMTDVKYCFTRVEEDDENDIITFNEKTNPIIGSWEDESDVVTFNDNETFNSFYYWLEGSYMLNESNSKITLLKKLSGKDEYYYTIDHDILTLYSDAEMTEVRYCFTRVE